MEVELYKWLIAHPLYTSLISGVLMFVIGWALPNDKVKMIGFNISQFIRRTFGKKLEEKIENVVSAIDDGMKSDNEKR